MALRNRSDLKSYFVKNAIPTEGNFADLIESQLNQSNDGIFKPEGEPLSVVAAPGDQKRILRFYGVYPSANPDWMISLNPAQVPNNAATARPGFGITDAGGTTRLFVDTATGRVGLGTNAPTDTLDVTGFVRANGYKARNDLVLNDYRTVNPQSNVYLVSPGNDRDAWIYRDAADSGSNWGIYHRNIDSTVAGLPANSIGFVGGGSRLAAYVNLGDGSGFFAGGLTVGGNLAVAGTVQGQLTLAGMLMPSAGNSEANGILFPRDPGGGGGDRAFIRYFAETGETTKLLIGVGNDADDRLTLSQAGGDRLTLYGGFVGVNTATPGASLDVSATTTTWGGWLEAIRLSRPEHSAITHPGGQLMFGMHGNRHFYFSDTQAGTHVAIINTLDGGRLGIGMGGSGAGPERPFHVRSAIGDWQGRFDNGAANVYLAHGLGYGMHIRADTSAGGQYLLEIWNQNLGGQQLCVYASGDVSLRGKHAFRASDTWLRLNQDGAFPNGVHTPGLFAPVSLNVGGHGGWGNPGANNAWIEGELETFGSYIKVRGAGGEGGYIGGDGAGSDVQVGSMTSGILNVVAYSTIHGFMHFYCLQLHQTSDERMKNNIAPITGALDKVSRLRPVSFEWKGEVDAGRKQKNIGLVAQQVKEVVPEAVSEGRDGTLAIAYNTLSALLIGAIQEQQQQIDELRAAVKPVSTPPGSGKTTAKSADKPEKPTPSKKGQ